MASPTTLAGAAPPGVSVPSPVSHQLLEQLVDSAAHFHLWSGPDPGARTERLETGGHTVGLRATQDVRPFEIGLSIREGAGITAANLAGDPAGQLEYCWVFTPHEANVLPGVAPPLEPFDPTRSQRFVMVQTTITLGDADGFHAFGTGRTFPYYEGGRPVLVVAAVGNIVEGIGRFRGHEGNFTLCGSWSPDSGFCGHIMVRILDPAAELLSRDRMRIHGADSPEPGITYITYVGRKPAGAADIVNTPSLAPDGSLRGLNIPVQLHRATVGFDPAALHFQHFEVGEIVGREIGFGKGSVDGASQRGTALDPFLFEGVSLYSFYDAAGNTVGDFTANVVEGRRFDVDLPGAPGQQALRFGFFGPIVAGGGCFAGARGMLYGASGSVFNPPPGDHVISNWYVARLFDPDGRFRARLAP